MILRKICVENFRQFKGKQEISFDHQLPGITIVYGENGRGKTGIFRALIFGLFGEKYLAQDGKIDVEDNINLINIQALEQANGQPVIASVSIIISNKNNTYEITRRLRGVKHGNGFTEEVFGISLTCTDGRGNTKPPLKDRNEINEIIGNVFDPKVKDYFFFDGEKIERLTRANTEQKKTVAQGIKNLLNINALENARRGMEILRDNLNKQTNVKSRGNLQKILAAVNDNANNIVTNKKKYDEKRNEYDFAIKEKKRLDNELEKIDAIKSTLTKRRELMGQEANIVERQNARVGLLQGKVSEVASALLEDAFKRVYSSLSAKKDAGEIPVQSKLDLINKILSDNKCICGTYVNKGSPEYTKIMAWKTEIKDSGLKDEAINIWSDLKTHLRIIPMTREEVARLIGEYDKDVLAINNIHSLLKTISENINDSAEEAARLYNQSREKINKDLGKYEDQLNNIEINAQQYELTKTDLARQKEKIIQEEGVKDELEAATMLATDTYEALDAIYHSFTDNMKQLLGQFSTKIMRRLLDEEGRRSLNRIVVKEDYSLQVNNLRDEPFLANISAGQRQIVSLCFITALAQVATGKDRFEIPLFMDTPFGRLSGEHRQNLIKFIPEICQQWITMVTDTELTEKEWSSYQNASCQCAFYKLCSQKDGTTLIRLIPPDEVTEEIIYKGDKL